jgi:hypothetical protein
MINIKLNIRKNNAWLCSAKSVVEFLCNNRHASAVDEHQGQWDVQNKR